MNISEQQILSAVAAFIWPFLRIGSMFVSIPVFSVQSLPAKVRVLTAFFITLVILPVLDEVGQIELFSYQGFLVTMHQILIGLATGFVLQMVFAVMLVGGQSIAYSMGLGFASMIDPATGVQVPVVAQVFIVSASLLFLSMNGHLILIEMLIESFKTLPIAATGFSQSDIWSIVSWSAMIFKAGVLLSLPVMIALLFVNLSFGVAARAAPQLQIFGVGFPISIMFGMVLIWVSLPNVLDVFLDVLEDGFDLIKQLLRLS